MKNLKPFMAGAQPDHAPTALTPVQSDLSITERAGMQKVLLIDDSTTQLLNSKFILKNAGYLVEIVSDSEQAIAAIHSTRPDLIITDLNMPKLDGICLVREIRKSADFLKTPILIMSTDSQKYKFDEARKAGATAWLTKPVKPESLLNAISQLLKQETAI